MGTSFCLKPWSLMFLYKLFLAFHCCSFAKLCWKIVPNSFRQHCVSSSAYQQMYPHVVRQSICHTPLKPLDGMRCHLAVTLVWPQVTRDPGPLTGEGDLGDRNPQLPRSVSRRKQQISLLRVAFARCQHLCHGDTAYCQITLACLHFLWEIPLSVF